MKKTTIIWNVCCVLTMTACSSDERADSKDSGKPEVAAMVTMLADGRTWNYRSVYFNYPVNDTLYHSITIEGPVTFDGMACYKLSNATAGVDKAYFREEGDKVYAYRQDPVTEAYRWTVEFDFGITAGHRDTVRVGDLEVYRQECIATDTICIAGAPRRRLTFTDDVWVEGIGSLHTGLYADWGVVVGSLMETRLMSVYDGDKPFFTDGNSLTGKN